MILSVIVYKHKLTLGQWGGAAVVFAGISVEAWVKRNGQNEILPTEAASDILSSTDVHAKRVIQEKERAKIKSL